MQVLVGPTYNMDVSASPSSPVCVRDRSSSGMPASPAAQDGSNNNNNDDNDNINKAASSSSSSSCLFLNGGNVKNGVAVVGDQNTYGSDNDSSDSSSIGAPGDSEDEDEDRDGVVSSSETGLGLQRNKFSMNSLEDSLTSKRGLSNNYSGKSKSFGNLTEVVSKSSAMAIKDLEKEENPFNKRRRLFIANKWSRKFFYSSRHNNPNKSMPLLPILPDDDVDEEEENNPETNHEHREENEQQLLHGNKLKLKMSFKSQSCFCLADLAEEEEQEEEEEDDDDH